MNDSYFGILVSQMENSDGSTFYAELEPSSPMLRYAKGASLRYRIRVRPCHLFTRWYFEINRSVPGDFTEHWYKYDGGAFTFRRAVNKAKKTVDDLHWKKEREALDWLNET